MFHLWQEGRFTTCGPAAPSVGEGRPSMASASAGAASLLDLRAIRPLVLLRDGRGGASGGAPAPWRGQET